MWRGFSHSLPDGYPPIFLSGSFPDRGMCSSTDQHNSNQDSDDGASFGTDGTSCQTRYHPVRERTSLRWHLRQAFACLEGAGGGDHDPHHLPRAHHPASRGNGDPDRWCWSRADAGIDRQPRACADERQQPGGSARPEGGAKRSARTGHRRGGSHGVAGIHECARPGRPDAGRSAGHGSGQPAGSTHLPQWGDDLPDLRSWRLTTPPRAFQAVLWGGVPGRDVGGELHCRWSR